MRRNDLDGEQSLAEALDQHKPACECPVESGASLPIVSLTEFNLKLAGQTRDAEPKGQPSPESDCHSTIVTNRPLICAS